MRCFYEELESSFGTVGVLADDKALLALAFNPLKSPKFARLNLVGVEGANRVTHEAVRQLQEYFAGQRRQFKVAVNLSGMSSFATSVLNVLLTIPYGTTVTYGELAALSGHPRSARAIGRVMAANPIPVVVPCHRVVGANGALTGYSGGDGIGTKRLLLAMERGQG